MTMITLEGWAQRTYGHNAPHRNTLRRWAREARIYPLPEKHGRQYFVREDVSYVAQLRYSRFPFLHPFAYHRFGELLVVSLAGNGGEGVCLAANG